MITSNGSSSVAPVSRLNGQHGAGIRKTYILDTNVLLHDPEAFNNFDEHVVIIPIKVIEEIDQFKREMSERGRSSRRLALLLDNLRLKGRLSDGINLPNGGFLRVMLHSEKDLWSTRHCADTLLLKLTQQLTEKNAGPCVLITKDVNLRLKADAMRLSAEDYENGQVDSANTYLGYRDLVVPASMLDQFAREGSVEASEGHDLFPNEYVMLKDIDNERHTLLGRFDQDRGRIVGLMYSPEQMRHISPRNREQHFALDALLNEKIRLVTLSGKAGSGKTLLAVAVGVLKTIDHNVYSKMLVSRPVFPMGKDLGYLPGTIEEKLEPWMQPIRDALDLLQHGRHDQKFRLENNPAIAIEPLTYIRGRSIHNQYLIIDEAQNLTPLEVKTVITRAGQNTKIVLTGDLQQIDNPYIDALSNGLQAVVEAFRNQKLAAHITFSHGIRSEIAELASDLL